MSFVFIDNTLVNLPVRFRPGDVIDEYSATILLQIQSNRIRARLYELLKKNEISRHEAQAKAEELAALPLTPYSPYDEETSSDPILDEALSIAKELITSRIAAKGDAIPKNLDTHAKALIDAMPEIYKKARIRVEARYAAAQSALAELRNR